MTETRGILEFLVAGLQPVIGDPAMPFLQRDAELAAGQVGAEAAVDPRAEGDVPVLVPIETDLERVGHGGGVNVGSPVHDHDSGALLDLLTVG